MLGDAFRRANLYTAFTRGLVTSLDAIIVPLLMGLFNAEEL